MISPQGSFRCQTSEVARSCQNTLPRSLTSRYTEQHVEPFRMAPMPRSFKIERCIWSYRLCRNLAHVGAHNSDWVFFFGPTVSIFNFNGLVHCVSADRAPTYPAADRRKTKPSDREARARLGDHDPPTPRDRAERSARA